MYKPQKVYYPVRLVERLLYASAVWHTFTRKQKDSIYETAAVNYVQ